MRWRQDPRHQVSCPEHWQSRQAVDSIGYQGGGAGGRPKAKKKLTTSLKCRYPLGGGGGLGPRDWIRASYSVGLLAGESICNRCEPGSAD